MKQHYNRLQFLRTITKAGVAVSLASPLFSFGNRKPLASKKVGIIGLDTSHSVAFTKALNAPDAAASFAGYKVVAAYPKGSNDIASSVNRIAGYTEDVKKLGVEIVPSIASLLEKVDVVLLETNDGRLHLQQALEVIKAGKPMFIDKPAAASLSAAMIIYDTAKAHQVPVFSASSLRFMTSAQEVVNGKIGKVLGADTYSPATLEKTHPDLFWYGIHGVEILYTVMGTGCKEVSRMSTESTDKVTGIWSDGRIGSFRGTRSGTHDYGGIIYGEKGNLSLSPFEGYNALLQQIIKFFETGISPVKAEETLEILAFMEAADMSKAKHGATIKIDSVMQKARKKIKHA